MSVSYDQRPSVRISTSGSVTEGIGGLAVVGLAIAGLSGLSPQVLAAIGMIVFGVSAFAEGGALAAGVSRSSRLDSAPASRMLSGGVSLEFIGGVATVALGILALAGVGPDVMLAAAVISGGALLMATSATLMEQAWLQGLAMAEQPQTSITLGTWGAAAGQFLLGVASAALGILASIPSIGYALTLELVGILVLGAGLLLNASTLTAVVRGR